MGPRQGHLRGERDLILYDAAWPPTAGREPVTDGFCFYIGAPGDTPHVWTIHEINRQPGRFALPIFVRSDPRNADPRADFAACRSALQLAGVPRGALVALDLETAADPAYTREFATMMLGDGWPVIVYGSKSTVFANHNPDGLYWAADWTNSPHRASGAQVTQYAAFRSYDLDTAMATLPLWDFSPPIFIPPVPTNWQDHAMSSLPLIKPGDSGPPVRTAQALAVARGQALTIDGIFGPATDQAIRQLQGKSGLPADGIVGPRTWPVLMGVV